MEKKRDPYDNVQYHFFFLPDWSETESAIILKTHHVFSDGLGYATMFAAMQEGKFDGSSLPGMKPLSSFKKFMIMLLSPFLILQATYDILSANSSYNAVKKNMPMTNRKNGAYTQDLDLKQFKEICKIKGCTMNDYIMSVFSNALYEFFDEEDDVIPRQINIGMPVSLREPANTLQEVRMANNFIAVPVRIPIRKTLDESLAILKPIFTSLKRSLSPFGCKMAF